MDADKAGSIFASKSVLTLLNRPSVRCEACSKEEPWRFVWTSIVSKKSAWARLALTSEDCVRSAPHRFDSRSIAPSRLPSGSLVF